MDEPSPETPTPAETPPGVPKRKRAALVAYEQGRKRGWLGIAGGLVAVACGAFWLYARSQPATWVAYTAPDNSYTAEFSTAPVRHEPPAKDAASVAITLLESHDDAACEILRLASWDISSRLDTAAESAYLDEVVSGRRQVWKDATAPVAVTFAGHAARKFTAKVPNFYRVTFEDSFRGNPLPGSRGSYDLTGVLTHVAFAGGGTRYYALEAIVSESHAGESDARFFASFRLTR